MPTDSSRLSVAYDDVVLGEHYNPRKDLGDLDELVKSIKERGLLQPILVQEISQPGKRTKFKLLAGERRYRACGKIGMVQIEARLCQGTLQEADEITLVENLLRKDLEPLEEAEGFKRYLDTYKCTQAHLAERVHKTTAYVCQRLALLKTAPEVKAAIENKVITATHAREIVALPPEEQKAVIEECTEKKNTTGKMATVAEVHEASEARREKLGIKADRRKTKEPEYDTEKVAAARTMFKDKVLTVRPKQAVLEQVGVLMARLEKTTISDATREAAKAQIAFAEWVLGLRESL